MSGEVIDLVEHRLDLWGAELDAREKAVTIFEASLDKAEAELDALKAATDARFDAWRADLDAREAKLDEAARAAEYEALVWLHTGGPMNDEDYLLLFNLPLNGEPS